MRFRYKVVVLSLLMSIFLLIGLLFVIRITQNDSVVEELILEGDKNIVDVKKLLTYVIGQSMKSVSLSEIENLITKQGGIAFVIARKQFPNKIRIKIISADIVAVVKGKNGRLRWVDQLGRGIEKYDFSRPVPVIDNVFFRDQSKSNINMGVNEGIGLSLCKAIVDSDMARLLLRKVVISDPVYAVSEDNGAKFIFGGYSSTLEEQVSHFEVFWKKVIVKKGLKNLEYADFRFKKKIFAKFN